MMSIGPYLNLNKLHNYNNIISIDNVNYNIKFNVLNEDNMFIQTKEIEFYSSNNISIIISFNDIIDYILLDDEMLNDKYNLINTFFFNKDNNFKLIDNVINNKQCLLDIFSFFKRINFNEIKLDITDNKYFDYINKLIVKLTSIIIYFEELFKLKSINVLINNDKIIDRIKLSLVIKHVQLTEFKVDKIYNLLTHINNTCEKYILTIQNIHNE